MTENRTMGTARRTFRIWAALVCILTTVPACRDVASGASLDADFVRVLKGDPEIAYFKIGFPGELFIVNGSPIKGTIYYEGSLQHDTFWVRNCKESPPLSGHMMPGWFLGMSYEEYWNYRDPSVTIASRKSRTPSALDTRVTQVRTWVMKAMGIGVMLKPGSFVLNPDNSFVAEGIEGDGKISGFFEVNDFGFPVKCELRAESLPYAKGVVRYAYRSPGKSMPSTITSEIFKGPVKLTSTLYTILACDFGKTATPTNGFTVDFMTNFGGVDLRYRNLMGPVVIQNGLPYAKGSNGVLQLVTQQSSVPASGRALNRRMTVLILLAAVSLVWVWLFRVVSRHKGSP